MESNAGRESQQIKFALLKQRLLQLTNRRIRNGEFTERGLARILGLSQPQVHNVLKGARRLSSDTADLLMSKLGVSLLDLISPSEFARHFGTVPDTNAPGLPVSAPLKKPAAHVTPLRVAVKEAS